MLKIVKKKIDLHLKPKYVVLDAGCGEQQLGKYVNEKGLNNSVIYCDLYPVNDHVTKVDLNQRTPYLNDFFNLVLCEEVFEHLDCQQVFLKEMHRILKKNGELILSSPNVYNWYTRLYYLIKGDLIYFTKADVQSTGHLRPLLETVFEHQLKGLFKVVSVDYEDNTFPLIHLKFGMGRLFCKEVIYVLKKI